MRFVLHVKPRDADAPGYYDLHMDFEKLVRLFRSNPHVDRLCRKMNMSRAEVLRHFTPGVHIAQETGEISLNAGYDPDFEEGKLEIQIWAIVSVEVSQHFGKRTTSAENQITARPGRERW